jgi:hypothetical protein
MGEMVERLTSSPSEEWLIDVIDSDVFWRRSHGLANEYKEISRVALRFITLGASEADGERLLSQQRAIQGIHGTNYQVETIHARIHLHVSRV